MPTQKVLKNLQIKPLALNLSQALQAKEFEIHPLAMTESLKRHRSVTLHNFSHLHLYLPC